MRPRVLAIVGLTGTGKTELACAVARRVGAEVIGADSMQVYRGLDVGTAKPSAALRREVPHHAIDVVAPDDPMTAGRYAELARAAASDVDARGHAIVLCGGTGLYARAFAHGLVEGVASDPAVRSALEALSTEDLRRDLQERDPVAARAIQHGDRVRMVRALEVMQLSGRRFSDFTGAHAFADRPYDVRWLALELERDALWQALRGRTERMFRDGLVDEVRALRAQGYANARPLQAIGYKQAAEVLDGASSIAEAIEATYLATRQYARRQRTWFNAEPACEWRDASDPTAALDRALELLER